MSPSRRQALGRPPAAQTIADLLGRRFVVLSGKGGVGRTTVAAALARLAARLGKRVLLAQFDAHARLGPLFGSGIEVGPGIVPLAPGVDAVNMTARAALHEYGLLVLRYETLVRALFENRPVRSFLSAVPGLDAYAMLGKAWYHTTETVQDGGRMRPRYDLVLVDGPASGHAVTMLRIPDAILATMPRGPLSHDARQLAELLRDPARAAFVVVTLAEELPVAEAIELAGTLSESLALPLGPLIVNALPAADWNHPELGDLLDRVPLVTGDAALDDTLNGVRALRARRREAERLLERLRRRTHLPLCPLPQLERAASAEGVERLVEALTATSAS